MFPLDIRKQASLRDRFSEGCLVSFEMKGGTIRIVNDLDLAKLEANMFFVKSLTFKKYNELTDKEARMISVLNDNFYSQWKQGDVRIGSEDVVSLVRFNLENIMKISPPSVAVSPQKILH